MSLFQATLAFGVLLLLLGIPLVLGLSSATSALKAFPRSTVASILFFGGGAAWFLDRIWNLSPADFGDYRTPLFVAFALLAALAFKCVPDLLAVRGACVLVLVAASPLLDAAFMQYDHPQRLFLVTAVYAAIALAIWFGAQPWRVRDFIGWLLGRPVRARILGGLLAAYGVVLCAVAFTY